MRTEGKITRWDDIRGFGFISWQGEEDSVFVHIKEFSGSSRRPAVGDMVTYELANGDNGKSRAENVRFSDEKEPVRKSSSSRSKLGGTSVAAALLFVGFLIGAAFFHRISWLVVAACGVMSIATFLVYSFDKLSAKLDKRRIPEATLHLMGLLGGWPGALYAQRLVRHKSSKKKFLFTFWITVFLNIAVIGYLVWSGESGFVNQMLDKLWPNML
ncbi:cold shock and DUF1294 domain-containing protein [Bremerella sp. JC817]|uniref:cold shock and DUF1294 domain-containing protein n=1 Tax=Bremerella sp. JC817 TaxID=3231756 RepID=UPI003457C7F4